MEGPWDEVARAVGLTLAYVTDAHVTGTSFETLRREMTQGTVAAMAPGAKPWLHGQRGEVAVIVRTVVMPQGFGASGPPAPSHTVAYAAVDPPLFAGLRMLSRDLVAVFGVARGEVPTGHPALDVAFLTYVFDYERMREIFVPRGVPDRLGDGLAQASQSCGILVKDSAVEAFALGTDARAERVAELVDVASALAREISARARTLRHNPLEVQAREAWQRLAARLGLSVDPLRWHMFGRLGEVEVSAMLEGSPPGVSTTFRARFRRRLPCPLFLRRGYRERRAPGGGQLLGYPELDALLVLHTHDHAQARALLGDPALRAMLAEEAKTSNLILDDRELVLGRGGFAGTREMERRLQALVAIVDRMTPPLPAAGPFR